jgi:hypothetical protein
MTERTEFERLQAQVTNLRRIVLALFIGLIGIVVVLASGAAKTSGDRILRARGIILEDENGRPRVLLGAPAPAVSGRRRAEPVNGLLILGPNGSDRLLVSYPGIDPQVNGRVMKRINQADESAGIMINDPEGNERAGFGASDAGRIALGMDYSDRDAIGLLVSPDFTGFAAFARSGQLNDQVVFGVQKDGTSMFKLADPNGDEHVILEVPPRGNMRALVMNPATRKLEDVAPAVKH